jgi:hypothetical protein
LNRAQFLTLRPSAAADSFYVETAVAYYALEGNFLRSAPSEWCIGEFFWDAQKAFSFYIETESFKQLQAPESIFNARVLSVTSDVRRYNIYVETAVDAVGDAPRKLLI